MKYNASAYLPAAIKARNGEQVKRPVKTAAELADDVKKFAYDINRGWAERYRNEKNRI